MTEPIRLTLGQALAEMNRRNDHLAAAGIADIGADFTPVEAVTTHTDLNAADIRAAAERVARLGRKANVTLVVLVPDPGHPYRDFFGGSAMLQDFAAEGRSVRMVADR